MTYKRRFIILKNDYQEMRGDAKGHSKLEMKGVRGIVTLNIENVQREDYYNVALLANDNKNSIWNLGKIFTDDTARGKGEYSFNQRELETNNFPISRLSAIVILKNDEVVLGGYIDKDDSSIERYISTLSGPNTINQYEEEPKSQSELEPEVEREDMEMTEDVEENEMTEVIEEIEEIEDAEEIEEINIEIEKTNELEDTEEYVDEEIESDEYSQEKTQGNEKLEHIKEINRKNQTTMYVLSILRFFPYIEPLEYKLKGFNWWIIEMDKENEYKSFLPYFSHIIGGNKKDIYSGNITCNDLMLKYKHYLFGIYNENEKVKYYVYGIPGKFSQIEHPNGGADGFNTWHKGKDDIGYWLVYIDPMRGKPVYPEIPMIPVD